MLCDAMLCYVMYVMYANYVCYVCYVCFCVCVMCVCVMYVMLCYVMLCYVMLRYVMLCYVMCACMCTYIYIYMNACKYIYACKIMQIYYRQISVPLEAASLFHLFGDDGDCVIIYISHIYIYTYLSLFISMLFLLHHPSISHSGSTITGLPPTKTGCQMAPPMDFGRHALW